MKRFNRDNLPTGFLEYKRRVPVRAVPIEGPFEVETREGVLTCPDGWLALDASGNPYPIASDEFPKLYDTDLTPTEGLDLVAIYDRAYAVRDDRDKAESHRCALSAVANAAAATAKE